MKPPYSPSGEGSETAENVTYHPAARPSDLWADCYYPWLPNGWVVCVCGATFSSDKNGTARANNLHAAHVEIAHNEAGSSDYHPSAPNGENAGSASSVPGG